MFKGQSIAVVIPAKDEETQILDVLTTLPGYVDRVYVVDDGSADQTSVIVASYARRAPFKVELIRHERSRGVGAAIAAGYARALADRVDVTAVMAGDGQMDPHDLELVIGPVVDGLADYCKGNRFAYAQGLDRIPFVRKIGNFVLSTLTKVVSGYWHVSDTQCGFTAIGLDALDHIPVQDIYPSYGCPNDILVKLNIAEMRVCEVPVNPLYHVGEQSKMRVPRVALPILVLLVRRFFRRLIVRYLVISGHPLVFAYVAALVCLVAVPPLGVYILEGSLSTGRVPRTALILAGIMATVGSQLLLTAFWMDSEANRHLCVRLTPKEVRAYREAARPPAFDAIADAPVSETRSSAH